MQSTFSTATGNLNAVNDAVTVDVRAHDSVAIMLVGSSAVMTISFEASVDGTTWVALAAVSLASTTTTTAVVSVANPTTGVWVVGPDRLAAVRWVRARNSADTSGTCVGTIYAGASGVYAA